MMVRYYWTDDGAPELCAYEKAVAEQDLECYHCLGVIPTGSEYVRLTALNGEVYVLHPEHEARSLQFERGGQR